MYKEIQIIVNVCHLFTHLTELLALNFSLLSNKSQYHEENAKYALLSHA